MPRVHIPELLWPRASDKEKNAAEPRERRRSLIFDSFSGAAGASEWQTRLVFERHVHYIHALDCAVIIMDSFESVGMMNRSTSITTRESRQPTNASGPATARASDPICTCRWCPSKFGGSEKSSNPIHLKSRYFYDTWIKNVAHTSGSILHSFICSTEEMGQLDPLIWVIIVSINIWNSFAKCVNLTRFNPKHRQKSQVDHFSSDANQNNTEWKGCQTNYILTHLLEIYLLFSSTCPNLPYRVTFFQTDHILS